MPVFHPSRSPMEREAMGDRVVWALIVAVIVLNVILMWRIATGGV